jgi:hypothetical protein
LFVCVFTTNLSGVDGELVAELDLSWETSGALELDSVSTPEWRPSTRSQLRTLSRELGRRVAVELASSWLTVKPPIRQ